MQHVSQAVCILICCFVLAILDSANGQTSVSFVQDSTLDNLVHPPDYKTAQLGTLGAVKKMGHGPKKMILIPGLGFGWHVYEDFMKTNLDGYTMYAVTLPGFGDTPAPPMPAADASYGENSWTRGALTGLLNLIESEKLEQPVIVANFVVATQLALRLAIDHPQKIGSVIIIGGTVKVMQPQWPAELKLPLTSRIAYVDTILTEKWFKTVTKQTWDENNYFPDNYSRDPQPGQLLWDEVAAVPFHVLIRYYSEFCASDVSLEFDKIAVPTLALIPDFDVETSEKSCNNFLQPNFGSNNWLGADANPLIELRTMNDAHLFMMVDQPAKLHAIVSDFVKHGISIEPSRLGLSKTILQVGETQVAGAPSDSALARKAKEYAGKYGRSTVEEEGGRLYIVSSEQKYELVRQSEDEFTLLISPTVRFKFLRDEAGNVKELHVNQTGQWEVRPRE
jgi:pimeloyl-ACP methyl ester carboxylesterase